MRFLWILSGGGSDGHTGNYKEYNLVEYNDITNEIILSDITNTCLPWTNINNIGEICSRQINNHIISGKKFLCMDVNNDINDYDNFYYVDNVNYEPKLINNSENLKIKNQLVKFII